MRDKIFAKNFHGDQWLPAEVVKITGPLSYQVETEDSLVLRRHVDHIRRRYSNNIEQESNVDEEIGGDGLTLPTSSTLPTSPSTTITDYANDPEEPSGEVNMPPITREETSQATRRSTRTRAPINCYSPSRYT